MNREKFFEVTRAQYEAAEKIESESIAEVVEDYRKNVDQHVMQILRLAVQANLSSGVSVLDVGCGSAYKKQHVLQVLPNAKYEGLEALPEIAARGEHDGVRCGFIEDMTEQGRYDYVLAHHVLEHCIDLDKALTAIWESMKTGASLAVVVPFEEIPDPAHVNNFGMEKWCEVFWEHGFTVVHHEEVVDKFGGLFIYVVALT